MFFGLRVAACADSATSLQKKKCELAQRAVGLSADDQARLRGHLAQFIADVTPVDTQIAELNRTKSQDKALRQSLAAQRQELVKGRVAALRDGLSALGTAQLDIHTEQMKAKIKIVPAPDLSE